MTPRADGWYISDTPGFPSIRFVTVGARQPLVGRTAAGTIAAIVAGFHQRGC